MDLNVMMVEQARTTLQGQLDAATTNGDTAEVRRLADELSKLAVRTAPKAPPYGDVEIRAELDKQDWFGVDGRKSAKAIEFGKTMNPAKFASAVAFAEAIVKAVNAEFPPPAPVGGEGEGEGAREGEGEGAREGEGEGAGTAKPPAKPRRTDGPGEGDALRGASRRAASGPWTKLSDAPTDVQTEIRRTADKYVPKSADPKVREGYISSALASHYQIHQRNKGKK